MNSFNLSDQIIGEIGEIFDALGDVSRLKILRALLEAKEPLCQGQITELTGLSQANASKHLMLLHRVGLIRREQVGNHVYFSPVRPLVDQVCGLVHSHVTKRVQQAYRSLV